MPDAQANLAKMPDGLTDEDVVLCPDIMSTGFSAAERGKVRIGDSVAVFAQGPIGLCATAGARLSGASLVIGVDSVPHRLEMAKRIGVDVVLNPKEQDVVAEIKRLTGGGVDVAIEALGQQVTFESALRSLRPGGTLSSLGVYSGHLTLPLDAIAAGLGDHHVVTTLCPGGKERMRRLLSVVESKRFAVRELVTHTLPARPAGGGLRPVRPSARRGAEGGDPTVTRRCPDGRRETTADLESIDYGPRMRQIVIPRIGGPEVLELRESADPQPKPGEVRIRVRFAGSTSPTSSAGWGSTPTRRSSPR